MLDILTVVLNTPQKSPLELTSVAQLIMVSQLDSPVPQSAFCLAHSPEFKPQYEQLNFFHPFLHGPHCSAHAQCTKNNHHGSKVSGASGQLTVNGGNGKRKRKVETEMESIPRLIILT